jgi:putative redox protein
MNASAKWLHGMSFVGSADSGFEAPLGAESAVGGADDGFRPIELLLVGLAGCTGMDVISILRKKRQEVTGFEVKIHADRAAEHPRVFTNIMIEYVFRGRKLDAAAVERAIELSETKYCPAQSMLIKAASIQHTYTIVEE